MADDFQDLLAEIEAEALALGPAAVAGLQELRREFAGVSAEWAVGAGDPELP